MLHYLQMAKQNNQGLEIYRGVIIRKSNVIRFRVGANKYKEILDIVSTTGFSIPKIISLSGKPCEKCKGICVTVYNAEDKQVEIRRGILSEYTMMNNGVNVLTKKR